VLRHNPAWLSVWGLGPLELGEAFQVPWDLIPLLLPRMVEPLALTDFAASGQRKPTEVLSTSAQLRHPHQELYLLSIPTRDTLGQLTGRLWVASDVTREREADRLKSEFVSVVSHELRTPLTSILGYTELLMARDFAPKEQKEFIKTVYDEANHLSQIVEDLLGVTRLESGKVKLNQWVVSMRQLINEVIAQINMHLTNRHRLVIDLPAQLPPAYIDRDKAKQILFNLLTNAVKYSPKGGEIILAAEEATAATMPEDHPPGRWLIVSVTDQGMGIPEEDLPRIWERFYRVDNSNTRRIGGTGLGLSIVKSLVDMHGGRIWATSTVGKGSTFAFTLPVATELVRT
jgi:signal transduction histidine kinase